MWAIDEGKHAEWSRGVTLGAFKVMLRGNGATRTTQNILNGLTVLDLSLSDGGEFMYQAKTECIFSKKVMKDDFV